MKKIFTHLTLAFIFITQTLWLSGCTRTVQSVEVVCDCPNEKFECSVNRRMFNVDGK